MGRCSWNYFMNKRGTTNAFCVNNLMLHYVRNSRRKVIRSSNDIKLTNVQLICSLIEKDATQQYCVLSIVAGFTTSIAHLTIPSFRFPGMYSSPNRWITQSASREISDLSLDESFLIVTPAKRARLYSIERIVLRLGLRINCTGIRLCIAVGAVASSWNSLSSKQRSRIS